ncbi:MAG: hypothetical protein UHE93_06785 [Muribaculaceae bacterium]|nr:hypothetical protein [Muribaculaceae bacterium]
MPASSFTPLSPASHLKSHLLLIMDSENASLLTNNISRSTLIMHTKPPDAILPSGHTLSHPDNKTPSNRLSYIHIGISDRPPSLHSFYNYYSHYQYYITIATIASTKASIEEHIKKHRATLVCHPMNVFRIV